MTASDTKRPWLGLFITLEGGEGAGKSTQAQALAQALGPGGAPVVLTREPGGVAQGERIRDLLVRGEPGQWSPLAEALLMVAARVEHWRLKIAPALARGDIVICDRFADSTMAYQGVAGGLGEARVTDLHRLCLGDVQPDLTLILDLPAEMGLARAKARAGQAHEAETRFERFDVSYHERLRQAFLDIGAKAPGRCHVIDARAAQAAVTAQIIHTVRARLSLAAAP